MNEAAFNKSIMALFYFLIAVLGLQLAWWNWQILAPYNKPIPPLSTHTDILSEDSSQARHLFGDAGDSMPTPLSETSAIRLKGVFAADGKTLSTAVVNLGGKDRAISLGEEIQPGVKLAEVHPDHIYVSRARLRERINIEERVSSNTAKPNSASPSAAGFRLAVSQPSSNSYSLSREELNNVLQDTRQLNFLGRIAPAASGGIRVEDAPAGTLSEKLGLKTGDLIVSVNGQPVNSTGDLARLYQQFATTSQIRAEVRRGSTPLLLTYSIKN